MKKKEKFEYLVSCIAFQVLALATDVRELDFAPKKHGLYGSEPIFHPLIISATM